MKFQSIGLNCIEFTGDTDSSIEERGYPNVIITTPEKWDSFTRKRNLSNLSVNIDLLMIDEIHFLNTKRGSVLEAIVSRVKSTGKEIRFFVASATISNPNSIAKWLSSFSKGLARIKLFGEEYRPVKLIKIVIGFNSNPSNNFFLFDQNLDYK